MGFTIAEYGKIKNDIPNKIRKENTELYDKVQVVVKRKERGIVQMKSTEPLVPKESAKLISQLVFGKGDKQSKETCFYGDKDLQNQVNLNLMMNKYYRIFRIDKFDCNEYIKRVEVSYFENGETKKIPLNRRNQKLIINSITNNSEDNDLIILQDTLELEDKIIVGLGEVSAHEVSIKLDHITGIPFIPASSIKGALRWYFENILTEEDNEMKELKDKLIKNNKYTINDIIKILFGSDNSKEASKGSLIFFDGYPDEFNLKKDIMAPHYSEYYNGIKSATEDLKLVVIPFEVVTGAKFEFNILIDPNSSDKNKEYLKEVKDILKELFCMAISTCGLGAKKSVGYGYFINPYKMSSYKGVTRND